MLFRALASVVFLLKIAISIYEWLYKTKVKTLKSERFKRNITTCHHKAELSGYPRPKTAIEPVSEKNEYDASS